VRICVSLSVSVCVFVCCLSPSLCILNTHTTDDTDGDIRRKVEVPSCMRVCCIHGRLDVPQCRGTLLCACMRCACALVAGDAKEITNALIF
jgi:hypothetical protein